MSKDKYLRSQIGHEWLIRPWFKDFHMLKMNGDHEFPSHIHTEYEVICVEKGPYKCVLNDAELVVVEGEALVIKPGDLHQDHLKKGQRHYVLHFSLGDRVRGNLALNLFSDSITPIAQIVAFPKVVDLFKTLENEAICADEHSAAIQDAALEAFFWRLVRCFPRDVLSTQFRQHSQARDFSDRLYKLFAKKVCEKFSLDDMARALGISRRSLTMKCAEFLGDSPAHLFARFKVQQAEILLRNTDQPVKEIAFNLGFENPYHFSRVFKTFCGVPPTALRM